MRCKVQSIYADSWVLLRGTARDGGSLDWIAVTQELRRRQASQQSAAPRRHRRRCANICPGGRHRPVRRGRHCAVFVGERPQLCSRAVGGSRAGHSHLGRSKATGTPQLGRAPPQRTGCSRLTTARHCHRSNAAKDELGDSQAPSRPTPEPAHPRECALNTAVAVVRLMTAESTCWILKRRVRALSCCDGSPVGSCEVCDTEPRCIEQDA